MNIIAIITAFLMLFGIMAYKETKQFVLSSLGKKMYTNLQDCKTIRQNMREEALFHDLHKPDQTKKTDSQIKPIVKPPSPPSDVKPRRRSSVSLDFNLSRIPDDARLNLWLVLNEKQDKNENTLTYYEIAATLMRKLYGHQPFFQAIPAVEYKLLDKLIAQKEDFQKFFIPDQLSTVNFEDPELQQIFYCMFRGSIEYPSLLHYISFHSKQPQSNKRKINLMFTPKIILESVFEDPGLIAKIDQLRSQLLEKMFYFEENRLTLPQGYLNRTKVRIELQEQFLKLLNESHYNAEAYSKLFYYNLDQPGQFLIVHDPDSGITLREYVGKRSK